MPTKAIGQEFLVNTRTERNQFNPAIAADAEGDFVITWESNVFSNLSQRFSANGTRLGGEIQGRLGSSEPDIAMDANGNFAIAQTLKVDPFSGTVPDIYLSKFDAAGRTRGGDTINKSTAGVQNYSAIAMRPTGEAVVVWQSQNPDESYKIYAQVLNANGKPVGAEIPVGDVTDGLPGRSTDQPAAQVAVDLHGNFVVTWRDTDIRDPNNLDSNIRARRFDSTGKPLSHEFTVNTTANGYQDNPAIAMNKNGDFVIAWHGTSSQDNEGIVAQRFRSDGSRLGGEFQVNEFLHGDQEYSSIAIDEMNTVVITWESDAQDGNSWGVYARRFPLEGSPDKEFQVNTFTTGSQDTSDIAMQPNGDFVVTWQSYGQDGAEYGVYAQRFQRAASVEFKHSEFKVNENDQVVGSEVKLVRSADTDLTSQVQIQVTGGSATKGSDYNFNSPLTVTFAPGETQKTVTIPILQDTTREGGETIQLQIVDGDSLGERQGQRAVLGHQSSATLTILDDDIPRIASKTSSDPIKPQTLRLGTPQKDRLLGSPTDEILIGLSSSDTMRGGDGTDTLIGVDLDARKPGLREIDVFDGDSGRDLFVLGDENHVFYNDGRRATSGVKDYALIKDFNRHQDVIQLSGKRSNYRVGSSPSGRSEGNAIYLETGRIDELVAIVQGPLRLNSNAIQFV